MAAERKLDIFRVLDAANAKNTSFYDTLTDEEAKAFVPFVIMRWMSGTPTAGQVYIINEYLNPFAFSLSNHKQLLWYLLTICNVGKKQRYAWNSLPSKKNTSKPNAVRAIKEYYHYSTSDAVNALAILTSEDIFNMAEQLGWQPDEISKLKKELKITKPTVEDTAPTPSNKKQTLLDF